MQSMKPIPSLLIVAALAVPAAASDQFWPRWRGPLDTGVSPDGDPPVEWAEGRNVRWKTAIPGEGSGSPIVWQDRVFVTSAVDTGEAAGEATVHEFRVYALRRSDGSILWQRTARREAPHEGHHPTGTWASNSAVTDGESVFAYFGSRGLFAYDLDGDLLWENDFGDMRTRLGFGEGSSPALWGDTLVLIWDHEGASFIVAVDKRSGRERWRVSRDEQTSWTTPLIVDRGDGPQVITTATKQTRAYDLETGALRWTAGGVTMNAIPSPMELDGVVFVTSGFMGNALRAYRLPERGGSEVVLEPLWSYDRDTPYVPSALLYEGRLYFLKSNNAVLTVLDAVSGAPVYGPLRVDGLTNVYSSIIGAAGRVYITDREGRTTVIRAGERYEVLARNELDDHFDASAAVVGGEIYLRGANLYCIAAE